MTKTKNKRLSKDDIKKMRGQTNWSKLLKDQEEPKQKEQTKKSPRY